MTIVIPTWLVIVLVCMYLFNSIYRVNQLVRGAKAVWPSIKALLDPNSSVDFKVSKTINK